MNYEKIYIALCEYCKNTTPIQRITCRDENDIRLTLNQCDIYTEIHHIVPTHAGGSDENENLVRLLPEEHFLAHLIRYKAYNDKDDFLSVRFIINGFVNRLQVHDKINYDSISFNKRIGLFKQHIQSFRKKHSWQTEDGIRRISEARKNTFPCVDLETGVSVGSHKKDHPKIISGEWVHHSKGKVSVTNLETGERLYVLVKDIEETRHLYKVNRADTAGTKNSNYKEMTPERKQRVLNLIPLSLIDNIYFNTTLFETLLKKEFKSDFKKISTRWVINNFSSIAEMILEYNNSNSTNYLMIGKTIPQSTRNKLAACSASKCRVYFDGGFKVINKKDLEEFLKNNPEYYRKRK